MNIIMEALGFHVMLLIQVIAEEESQPQIHYRDKAFSSTRGV
jgi:hypothetical protein